MSGHGDVIILPVGQGSPVRRYRCLVLEVQDEVGPGPSFYFGYRVFRLRNEMSFLILMTLDLYG